MRIWWKIFLKIITDIRFIILAFVITLANTCSHRNLVGWNCKRMVGYLHEEYYYGVVSGKEVQRYNHGSRRIHLKVLDKRSYDEFVATNAIFKGVWEVAQEGDTLIKERNSADIRIKGPSVDTVFHVSCK